MAECIISDSGAEPARAFEEDRFIDDFIHVYSKYRTVEELLMAGGVPDTEDAAEITAAMQKPSFDMFIAAHTRFRDWHCVACITAP